MKAISVKRFGGPEVLELDTVADPVPGDGQVLVRVRAAGVNPVETYVRSGKYAALPELPYTPGTDAAGVIEAVGAGVERFRPGDRVYTAGTLSGTYAELALAHAASVHPLPGNVGFAQGAALGVPYATAYRALFQRAGARAGETLLVHGGTGGVGLGAIQLGVAAGLHVIATGGSEDGRKLASAQRAEHVLDHHRDGYLDELMRITSGRGADVILEMLANVNLGRDLTVLAPAGRVVVIGSRGPIEINPRDLMARDAAILGMILWKTPADDLARIHAGLYGGLATGALKPVIAAELPLDQAPRGHECVMESGAQGKIVLVP